MEDIDHLGHQQRPLAPDTGRAPTSQLGSRELRKEEEEYREFYATAALICGANALHNLPCGLYGYLCPYGPPVAKRNTLHPPPLPRFVVVVSNGDFLSNSCQ
jgi:hypothetical protein